MNILSLGAGVQSSTVLLMSCRGVLPKLDGAIFADTGWEPQAVYDYLTEILLPAAKQAGVPVHYASAGNILADWQNRIANGTRAASIPFFTEPKPGNDAEGRLGRQCTEALGMVYQSRPHKVFHAKRAVLNGLNNEGGSDGISTIVSSVGLDTQPTA